MRAFINAVGGIAATVFSLFVIFVAAAIGPSLLAAMFWLGVSGAIAFVAKARERSAIGWYLISLLLSPIIAAIIIAMLPNPREERLRLLRHKAMMRRIRAGMGGR